MEDLAMTILNGGGVSDMAEIKMPKFVFKDKTLSLDECYRELADMSYLSPVNIIYQGVQTKMEGDTFEAILSYGVDVDKDELVKALRYDRDQYRKGFSDGCLNSWDTIRAEVEREIFEEIENNYADSLFDGCRNIVVLTEKDFCELKKKYTGGE